jgi:hypothetical protein
MIKDIKKKMAKLRYRLGSLLKFDKPFATNDLKNVTAAVINKSIPETTAKY